MSVRDTNGRLWFKKRRVKSVDEYTNVYDHKRLRTSVGHRRNGAVRRSGVGCATGIGVCKVQGEGGQAKGLVH